MNTINTASNSTSLPPEEHREQSPQGSLQGHTVSKDFVVIPPPGQPVTGAFFIEKHLEGLLFTIARFANNFSYDPQWSLERTVFYCFHLLPHMNSEQAPPSTDESKPHVRQATTLAKAFLNAAPHVRIEYWLRRLTNATISDRLKAFPPKLQEFLQRNRLKVTRLDVARIPLSTEDVRTIVEYFRKLH